MTNAIEIAEFSSIKLMQSSLFNEQMYCNLLHGMYDSEVFTLDFIYSLQSHIEEITKLGLYEEEQINRLYGIISYIREHAEYENQEQRKEYFLIYNDMIVSLNKYEEMNSDNFYIREAMKRFHVRQNVMLKPNDFQKYKILVKESIGHDYTVLNYSLEFESEETFQQNIDYFSLDMFYFASLNALIIELPQLLDAVTLRRRVKQVVELNKQKILELRHKTILEKRLILKLNYLYSKEFKEA